MTGYHLSLISLTGIMIVFAVSLNMIMGLCGQVSLGHAAFYGVGAYVTAMMSAGGVPTLYALPVGMLIAGLMGLIVGFASLRVRDDFLAITTLAVGFLFVGVVRKSRALGGEFGISGIPESGLGPAGDAFLVAFCVVLTVALSVYLSRNWTGLAFRSISANEEAAQTLGINSAHYKLLAFCIGCALAGLAGGLYANYARFIVPGTFGFSLSITAAAMVVIGGIGSTAGVVAGAVLLTLFPEIFRFLGDYRMLVYGALLVGVMLFQPKGLAGIPSMVRRWAGPR